MPRGDERTPVQAREILAYFLRNPQAVDSLEGVAQWRIADDGIHSRVEEVQSALDWLVTNGFLVRAPRNGPLSIYSLNQENRIQAERLVRRGVARR